MGESTHTIGVDIGIKEAHPLHIDNAPQPHDVRLLDRILSCHTAMIDISTPKEGNFAATTGTYQPLEVDNVFYILLPSQPNGCKVSFLQHA